MDAGYIALLPIAAFWSLDGYFLFQERLFRAHYDHVCTLPNEDIDFAMNVSTYTGPWRHKWLGATFSQTLLLFYGALLALVLVAVFALDNGPNPGVVLRFPLAPVSGNG